MLFTFTFLLFYLFTFLPFLNPLAGINEGLNPWRYFILTTVGRIPGVLPWEYGTLQMRHHAEMTTIS
jgi:hypothetical protein